MQSGHKVLGGQQLHSRVQSRPEKRTLQTSLWLPEVPEHIHVCDTDINLHRNHFIETSTEAAVLILHFYQRLEKDLVITGGRG